MMNVTRMKKDTDGSILVDTRVRLISRSMVIIMDVRTVFL